MNNVDDSNDNGSMPTETVAVESKQEESTMKLISDMTDANGVRHVELLTTAAGNDRKGYKAAQDQAHSWFFAVYSPNCQSMTMEESTARALQATELGLSTGRITEEWIDAHHPIMTTKTGSFMFGHHVGINPESPNDTWKFEFEIVPMGRN